MTRRLAVAVAVAVAALAACGGDADDRTLEPANPASPPDAQSSATGPGLAIEEAKASPAGGPLLVRGALFVEGDEVRLCSALAESDPPQCSGTVLTVVGLDAGEIPGLERKQGVGWVEEYKVLGEIHGDELHVTNTSSG